MTLDLTGRHIDNGWYRVTVKEAKALCIAADLGGCFAGRLPKDGKERRVRVNSTDCWLSRTVTHGKTVWSVHPCGWGVTMSLGNPSL